MGLFIPAPCCGGADGLQLVGGGPGDPASDAMVFFLMDKHARGLNVCSISALLAARVNEEKALMAALSNEG